MRKQYRIYQFYLQDNCIFIAEIVVSVIDPIRKGNSQFICNSSILLISKISQITAFPMRSEPFTGNCSDRILCLSLFFELLATLCSGFIRSPGFRFSGIRFQFKGYPLPQGISIRPGYLNKAVS